MAVNFTLAKQQVERTARIIMETLPVDSERQISYATFTIADNATDGADKQLKVFRAKGLNNEKIDDPEIIEVGNNVVIFGKLQKYVKDDVVTPEVSSCYIYSINAQSGIKGLTAGERPTLLYNLNGQKVDAGYRGIVVKNGKKVLMK